MSTDVPSRKREIARAVWLAMVNDEAPDDETLRREGFFDAADAVGALTDQHLEGLVKALGRIAAGPNMEPHAEPWSKAEALIALDRLPSRASAGA